MSKAEVFDQISMALQSAPQKGRTVELHLQIIKHADVLGSVTGKEFCEGVGIGSSFHTEFSKMKNIAPRLKAAGLRTEDI